MGNTSRKSTKNESRVTEHDKAVLQLKIQRDKVRQYHRRIEVTMEKEQKMAKRLVQEGKRERAKLMLRKKRFEEQMLGKVEQQLENLDSLLMNLEFTQIEQQVIAGLKVGNDCLKRLHETFKLEDVERILDESRAGVEYQQEIDSLLSGSITGEDNEAVEEEFARLIKDQMPEIPRELPVQPETGDFEQKPVSSKIVMEPRQEKQKVLA